MRTNILIILLASLLLMGCAGKKQTPDVVVVQTSEPRPANDPTPGAGVAAPVQAEPVLIVSTEPIPEPEPEEPLPPEIPERQSVIVAYHKIGSNDEWATEIVIDGTHYLVYGQSIIRK